MSVEKFSKLITIELSSTTSQRTFKKFKYLAQHWFRTRFPTLDVTVLPNSVRAEVESHDEVSLSITKEIVKSVYGIPVSDIVDKYNLQNNHIAKVLYAVKTMKDNPVPTTIDTWYSNIIGYTEDMKEEDFRIDREYPLMTKALTDNGVFNLYIHNSIFKRTKESIAKGLELGNSVMVEPLELAKSVKCTFDDATQAFYLRFD
jgi:hypothetical protein